jgi:eukaryotic-like serine/threonine-protein kinase
VNERDLFINALQIEDPAERCAYLDKACGDDGELRQRVEALLAAFGQAGSFLQQPAADPTATSDIPPAGPSHGSTPAEGCGAVIGPYKLLQQIGEGGMGTVYMAEQTHPVQRKVALKIIKAGMDSQQIIARFEAERQALALMDHPNIARVLDAGATEAGRPYFVMELVKGVPITRYCDEHHLTPKERLELFVPVCQAVQHAHQQGIIHRDIKPSNVMVCLYDGQPIPKVIDFGIAKATDSRLTEKTLFTELGQVVGTLEYMSPEQAELNQIDIDTRSDIYSLGVLLYELLTGTTPLERKRFKMAAFLEVLRLIREEESPRPSMRLSTTEELPSIAANRGVEPKNLRGLVRGELDWIVMKALEKSRNRRYETASAFAADVQRFLHDEPVQACPPSRIYRLRKFARRNRLALAVTAVVAAALATVGVALIISEMRVREEQQLRERALNDKLEAQVQRGTAEKQRADKERERAEAKEGWRRTAYYRQIALAFREYRDNNLVRADEMLGDDCPEDLRGWEWHYLKRLCHSELTRFKAGSGGRSNGWSFTTGAGRLAVLDSPYLRIFDTTTGKEVSTYHVGFFRANEATFSLDGRLLATSAYSQWHDVVYLWDTATGANLARLYGRKKQTPTAFGFNGAVFSPDGRLVAATDRRGNLFVWELDSGWGRLQVSPAGLVGQMFGATAMNPAEGPLGCTLVTLSALVQAKADPFAPQYFQDVLQRQWTNLPGGKAEEPPFALRFQVAAHPMANAVPNQYWHTKAAFSPDGKLIATASSDAEMVKLWDATTGKEAGSLGKATGFSQVAFSPSGKWIAALGGYENALTPDQAVWVWDARTRQLSRILRGQGRAISCLAFCADEQLLATGSWDGTLTFWDLGTGQEVSSYRGHVGGVLAAAFSADGRRVVALGNDKIVRTWDATRQPECVALRSGGAWQAAFSSDNRLIAAAGKQSGADFFGVFVWDAETWRELASFGSGHESCYGVALSPDGRQIAAAVSFGTRTGTVKVWDLRTGELIRNRSQEHLLAQVIGAESVAPAALPATGPLGPALLRLAALQGTNWDGFGLVRSLPEPGLVGPQFAVAWSPDGQLIAAGGQDRIVRIWEAATGKQLRELGPHARTIGAVAFSRDGQRLVSASGGINRSSVTLEQPPSKLPLDGPQDIPDVKVWDVATGEELRSWSLPGKGPGLALSPDGETVAVSFGDNRMDISLAYFLGSAARESVGMYSGPGGDVVRLYRVATGKQVAVLKGHTRPPWCVAFSPDGQRVVTGGGADDTIKLWDPKTGEEIMTVGRQFRTVVSVAFSPDGLKIISTRSSGEIRVWDATPLKK